MVNPFTSSTKADPLEVPDYPFVPREGDAVSAAESAASLRPMQPPADIRAVCEKVARLLRGKHWQLATAESCTGGLIAAACTDAAGASVWFDRGFVAYSNDAKRTVLGVDGALIDKHGSVSEEVVQAMTEGALERAYGRVALAVTGVAGPGGGTEDKPLGTVWFGWSVNGKSRYERRVFDGDRAAVREATVHYALQSLLVMLQDTD